MASNLEPKINRIATAVTSALSALTAKGVTVPEGANVESLAALIESIEAGGGGGDCAAVLDSLIDKSVTEISNDRVTSIGAYAFYRTNLETANFPSATSIAMYAFSICGLTTVKFPAVMRINNFAFYFSSSLTTADFPVAASIGTRAFYGCSALTALILRKTDAVCTLSSNDAFSSTPIASGTGYIYVPSALVYSYKEATNWSIYSDQIRAIEDFPDITGGAE